MCILIIIAIIPRRMLFIYALLLRTLTEMSGAEKPFTVVANLLTIGALE